MGWFHQHQWEVVSTTVCPVRREFWDSGMKMSHDMAVTMLWGTTTHLLKCECGKTQVVEMRGVPADTSSS
jgi:hypothetical protein